jgi:heme exporter protein B
MNKVLTVAKPPFSSAVQEAGPGLLWMVFLFTGLLGLSRSFVREKELGTLEGLKLSPVDPGEILLGKMIYNFVMMLLVQITVFPLFMIFLNYEAKGSILLAFAITTLGILGFVIVGSAMSVLVLNAKARELLLPVILFPVLFPLITASIQALKNVLVDGATIINTIGEVKLMVAYIGIMSVVALLTFEYALEE